MKISTKDLQVMKTTIGLRSDLVKLYGKICNSNYRNIGSYSDR